MIHKSRRVKPWLVRDEPSIFDGGTKVYDNRSLIFRNFSYSPIEFIRSYRNVLSRQRDDHLHILLLYPDELATKCIYSTLVMANEHI